MRLYLIPPVLPIYLAKTDNSQKLSIDVEDYLTQYSNSMRDFELELITNAATVEFEDHELEDQDLPLSEASLPDTVPMDDLSDFSE